jgi:hypothetical protein
MINVSKLAKYFFVDKLIYHSIDISLYQASVVLEGKEHYITDDKGKVLRSFKLIELQKILCKVKAKETVLRQESAYDEMIGGPEKTSPNTLEVPWGDTRLY